MGIIEDNQLEFFKFPESLRKLVQEELAAGNQVLEFGHGFPAAPCGAYIKLASLVSSRERIATEELDFYDRDSNSYSGEFTDSNRHFFVLEPPNPPKPAPDMDAIRAALDAEHAIGNTLSFPIQNMDDSCRGVSNPAPESLFDRFVKSMEMDYDKWREGEGYDLSLLAQASETDREDIERKLLRNAPLHWRDIEALAIIDSQKARAAIMNAFFTADTETRMSVHRYAPDLISEQLSIDSIIRALRESEIFSGLSQALDEIEEFHPPEVIQELLRGLMQRDGATACHFAAMLYYLHGLSGSAFDWDHRPFFLKFNTDNLVEREVVVRELCQSIGVAVEDYL